MSTTHGAGTLVNLTKNIYSGDSAKKDKNKAKTSTEKYKKLKEKLKKSK